MLSDRYRKALQLAFEIHQNDCRKGKSVPYMAHLLGVSSLVLEDGGDEDEAIAALLHDTLEDHPDKISLKDIQLRFGVKVAEIVKGCTDTPDDYVGGPKPPWKTRKQAYLEHLNHAPEHTLRVALADKLHNARDICNDLKIHGTNFWGRFNAPREEQLWYFDSLLNIFSERLTGNHLLLQFRDVVGQLKNQI